MIFSEDGHTKIQGTGKEIIRDFVCLYYSIAKLENGTIMDKIFDTLEELEKEDTEE